MIEVNANGAKIPAIGFGTWTLKGEPCVNLVRNAIAVGYRHIDTAAFYDNEEAVGEGIRASGVERDELFVTSKVWHTELKSGDLERSVEASLKRLQIGQLDLALIHWPSKIVPLAESIEALNRVRDSGMTRHIGVANFTIAMIDEAMAISRNPLVSNQIEYHPCLDQSRVIAACRRHGMAVTAYCPLNRAEILFDQAAIKAAAKRTGKSPAQVVLRWHVQQPGVIAIPRTTNPIRLVDNLSVFDFQLTGEEMESISALKMFNYRRCDYDFSPQWDPA